ncbi:hypothetical protein A6V39_05505 [Candidatus Mycoplasma haematobovis]|uniref:Uncharacterized protein n=1 Tax=Candidatus Mycoplasma haematobovis TaxID=432608 RepID=A0A1A9QB96_9MOLU|nr:hypothetical protein [Candidatus Mycoplasma haematobovis]OAL09727.1 hypothetical protein A6V39_05505 [Candidatus Mycoplasma haematobovis]
MAFSSVSDPEVITAICIGVATVLGAIATCLKKIRGKSWKELLTNINKEELKIISDTVKEQTKLIKEVINEKEKTNKSKQKKV